MAVIFHVIVPLKIWNVEKSNVKIFLRGGEHSMGYWKKNIGNFLCERSVCLSVCLSVCRFYYYYFFDILLVFYASKKENEFML